MPVDKETQEQVFSGPIPGESLTSPKGNAPYEKPPQFARLEDAMDFLFNQLLEPAYLKQLLKLLDAGMSVEAVARTILFGGFTMGKWTPDVAMLMYKPTMLTIVTLAKAAGLNHTPIVMKESLDKYLSGRFKEDTMYNLSKRQSHKQKEDIPEMPVTAPSNAGTGFLSRRA